MICGSPFSCVVSNCLKHLQVNEVDLQWGIQSCSAGFTEAQVAVMSSFWQEASLILLCWPDFFFLWGAKLSKTKTKACELGTSKWGPVVWLNLWPCTGLQSSFLCQHFSFVSHAVIDRLWVKKAMFILSLTQWSMGPVHANWAGPVWRVTLFCPRACSFCLSRRFQPAPCGVWCSRSSAAAI